MDREARELVMTLEGFPAFQGVGSDDLGAMVKAGRVMALPERWAFLKEGTPADAVYVLLEGTAQVRRHDGGTVDLEPGAVLGEMALLGHSLRKADVVTTSRVRVFRIDYEQLQKVFVAHPTLQAAVGAVYTEHTTERS